MAQNEWPKTNKSRLEEERVKAYGEDNMKNEKVAYLRKQYGSMRIVGGDVGKVRMTRMMKGGL